MILFGSIDNMSLCHTSSEFGDHRLVLIGAPASGKGSQAKRLAKKLGILHLSTGAVIRDHIRRETEMGERCRDTMNAARLVSDEIVMEVVASELGDHRGGYVLDGFPRTLQQAEMLDDWLGDRGSQLTAVISLEVPKEDLERRVLSRVVCLDCGYPFRLGGRVNSVEQACPECAGKLGQRADDNIDMFHQRYGEFEELTIPLIDYYRRKGLLQTVDGSQMPDEVFKEIENTFDLQPSRS